jgi:DNA-directed RNA polymerase subunit H (RpoH/RPB5)
MSDLIDRLQSALSSIEESPKKKINPVDKTFDPLIKEINSRFGKKNVLGSDNTGALLVVRISRDSYTQHQDQLSLPIKQEWISDKGYALLSIQGDVDPSAVKIYFCKVIQMQ